MSYGGGSVAVLDLEPTKSDLLTDVIAGLTSAPRTLPCKYFYDERGSELFQKICELPEYYVTRTEIRFFGCTLTKWRSSLARKAS